MQLMKGLDNLTCCHIDLLCLNSYINTGYYIIHFLDHFILLHFERSDILRMIDRLCTN